MFLPLFVLAGTTGPEAKSCLNDVKIQELRSKELKDLYSGDQADRKEIEAHLDKTWPKSAVRKMASNDLKRRRRVAEIFAEGGFKTAADYGEAAMVYQHGTVPDHFFQTFIWAKRAVELGDSNQKQLVALGIDRYLMSLNQAQLFGSQAKKMTADDLCWCLWPVEASFPETTRSNYLGMTLDQKRAWLKEINGKNDCPVAECKVEVKRTPKGSVAGFW